MSRTIILLPLVAAAMTLAACGKSADDGTTISLKSDDGKVHTLDSNSSAVKIDLPGFKGEVKLPKIQLDADNFDLNGVHLYPGSKIDTFNIDGSKGDGGLRLGFSSPADPVRVRDWFGAKLRDAGFDLKADGNALVGTTDDKKPFRMDLAADGGQRTKGLIKLGN